MSNLLEKCEVVIIGAGIGGLACGLYLAKEGIKVTILEQHTFAGGYCSSFKRKGFTFDSAIHYFGSCRETGWVGRFLSDHQILRDVTLQRSNPSDVVIVEDINVPIYNNIFQTAEVLSRYFPKEKENIVKFFDFITASSFPVLYARTKTKTFQKLLDEFFKNQKLKTVFSVLIGNMELPPDVASALSACILFREFVFDGGYYPLGGMQKFVNVLVSRFLSYGGEIIFSKKVTGLLVKSGKVIGVKTEKELIYSDFVVANSDAIELFTKLVPEDSQNKNFAAKLSKIIPSPSTFIVYLGLSHKLDGLLKFKSSTWFLPDGDLRMMYDFYYNAEINLKNSFVFCGFPSFRDRSLAPTQGETMFCIIGAPFIEKNYWEDNKALLADNVIGRAEKLVPGLRSIIEVQEVATPWTLYRYTSNHKGALMGWANIPSQIDPFVVPYKTYLKNLYMCGHWTTPGFGQGGIGMVIYSGRTTANAILKSARKGKCVAF